MKYSFFYKLAADGMELRFTMDSSNIYEALRDFAWQFVYFGIKPHYIKPHYTVVSDKGRTSNRSLKPEFFKFFCSVFDSYSAKED